MRPLRLILSHAEVVQLARALESSIMMCGRNAQDNPDESDKWFAQAHKLEQKFTNEFGKHYSYYLYEVK